MLGESIGRGAWKILGRLVGGLAKAGVHPNFLTAFGVCINVGCGVLFGMGEFFWAGYRSHFCECLRYARRQCRPHDRKRNEIRRLSRLVARSRFGYGRISRHYGILRRKFAAAFDHKCDSRRRRNDRHR